MNRRERRATANLAARHEIHEAMRAAASVEHFEVAADIGLAYNIDTCPVCLKRPIFDRNPDGTPVEDHGQRVRYHDRTFWICEACAARCCVDRSTAQPVALLHPRRAGDELPTWTWTAAKDIPKDTFSLLQRLSKRNRSLMEQVRALLPSKPASALKQAAAPNFALGKWRKTHE